MLFARLSLLTILVGLLHARVCQSQVVRRELKRASYYGIGSDLNANAVIHSDCKRLALLRSGRLEIIDLSSLRLVSTIWNQEDEAKRRDSMGKAKIGHLVASHTGNAIALVLPSNGSLVIVFDQDIWREQHPEPVLVQSLPERVSLGQVLFKSDPYRMIIARQPLGKRGRGKGELYLIDISSGLSRSTSVDGPLAKIWDLADEESVAVILGMDGEKGILVHVNLDSGDTKTIMGGSIH